MFKNMTNLFPRDLYNIIMPISNHLTLILSTHKFLEDHGVAVLKTLAESPDLNPIKNMWHELKHYILTEAKPRTKEELLEAVKTFGLL